MSNKRMPNLSVTDGFDFVKKIWGSLPIPSVMSPTTDLDELDKRISDLKAVEQWLNINLGMLRATIQGLEVQRGTIATIKSFGSNLGLGEKGGGANQAVNEELLRNAMQAAITPQPIPRTKPVDVKTPASEPDVPAADKAAAAAHESSKAIVSNAAAWWGLLQEQFNKVATVVESEKPAKKPAKKPVTKPVAAKATPNKKPASSRSRSRP